jgi:hypothetical protein
MARQRNVKAWLITWEGDHGKENNVAMLLHPATAEGRVADLVALLYANERGTFGERLIYAMERDRIGHPYRARLASRNSRELEGHFICGETPSLYARLVEHVTVETCDNGPEVLRWVEIDD